ncbi:peptidoglycan-binding domain-containing protein [Streptomyces sp. NBC_00328]|uniref:peptidoglycan-binding domain-containing protein n=1 Tax=Streptomyces sp. NBC_00328 TaxID=2903646 RepID=UPI002E2B99F3|nr:peptidoglycan-binding protein [Streptomyces sp. NBC_00328]
MNNISRKTRYRVTALAAAALAFGVVAGPATTAQAATAQGFVNGWDNFTDDWADEGILSTTQHANSGATGLWQLVLWQDGYLSESDVDCKFGPKTQAATKKWQAHYLRASEADGVVGNKTFGEASQHIGSTDNGFSLQYGSIYIGRNVNNGEYFFHTDYTNGFVDASYTSAANCR